MAITYTVEAEIVDITTDSPKTSDIFLVDTNVWFWTTYPTASQSASHYQTTNYPSYLNNALKAGSKIYRANTSLSELSHCIEATEHEIYSQYVKKLSLKEYRHNESVERARIVSHIETVWKQVESLAVPLDVNIDEGTTASALARLKTQRVDGYDLFLLETMAKNGVVKIITDDCDFITVPGIQVFTANKNVIDAAKRQKKYIRRS